MGSLEPIYAWTSVLLNTFVQSLLTLETFQSSCRIHIDPRRHGADKLAGGKISEKEQRNETTPRDTNKCCRGSKSSSKNSSAQLRATALPEKPFKFSELSLEVQNLIWGYVAFYPKIIKLFSDNEDFTVYAQMKVPALLHTTSEARRVSLKFYNIIWQRSEEDIETDRAEMNLASSWWQKIRNDTGGSHRGLL